MQKNIRKIILKKNKSKIVCLTAYSKNISQILDKYCDIVLVGDSMANVLYGFKDTHKISLKNIVLETDSPYLAPVPYRGKRNESSYIIHVVEKLSEIYDLKIDQIIKQTSLNSHKIFNFDSQDF